ncbi:MAG: hypothetical protein JWP89_1979 [Schlesneria sp.]|nr:hypothetical protein [Schlesneria sp.]
MIIARCPVCSHEVKAPESFVGKKVRCKSEECGEVFLITGAPSLETLPQPPVDLTIPEAPAFMSLGFATEKGANAAEPSIPAAADVRYPNLQKYLRAGRVVAMTQLGVTMTISCTILLLSFIYPLSQKYSFQGGMFVILIGAGVSALTGLAGYLIFVFCMAGIEFVHVIIDIESNTRTPQYHDFEE